MYVKGVKSRQLAGILEKWMSPALFEGTTLQRTKYYLPTSCQGSVRGEDPGHRAELYLGAAILRGSGHGHWIAVRIPVPYFNLRRPGTVSFGCVQ